MKIGNIYRFPSGNEVTIRSVDTKRGRCSFEYTKVILKAPTPQGIIEGEMKVFTIAELLREGYEVADKFKEL